MDPVTVSLILFAGILIGVGFRDELIAWAQDTLNYLLRTLIGIANAIKKTVVWLSKQGGKIIQEIEVIWYNINNGRTQTTTKTKASPFYRVEDSDPELAAKLRNGRRVKGDVELQY